MFEENDIKKRHERNNVWDPSKVHCLQECARKFFFTYVANIGLKGEPDFFVSGRAIDQATAALHDPTEPNLETRYQNAVSAINRVYDETSCEWFNPKRERDQMLLLLERYLEQFPTEPFQTIATNLPLRVKYLDFYLGGELDSYLEWEPYGLVIGETKTSLQIPGSKRWDNYVEGFSLGSYAQQITHYDYIVERTLGKKPYGTCVFTWCLDIPKRPTTVRQLFSRIWVEHNPVRTDDWLSVVTLINEKYNWCWDNWLWPMEGQKCTGAWGSVACGFRHLCKMPVPLERLTLPDLYEQKGEWAPWDGIKGR